MNDWKACKDLKQRSCYSVIAKFMFTVTPYVADDFQEFVWRCYHVHVSRRTMFLFIFPDDVRIFLKCSPTLTGARMIQGVIFQSLALTGPVEAFVVVRCPTFCADCILIRRAVFVTHTACLMDAVGLASSQ